ncbi:MAG: TAXI family TRAP transporter solute-binding subunit [Acidiferrobacterales bacterium]
MRNAIYGGIVGLVIGMFIGVYGIAPEPAEVTAEKEGFARESEVKEAVASADRKQIIVIGTGDVKSAYHAAGIGICRFVNKGTKEHGVECKTKVTGGDEENINTLQRRGGEGELTMGVAQSRWVNLAYQGYRQFQAMGPNKDIRAVLSLHPQPITMVARADSGIKHVMDLKGKRVNIGNPNSLQRDAMDVLMGKLGWSNSSFSKATEMNTSESVTALCDNELDAIVVAEGNPSQHIRDASYFCDIVLVEVTGPAVDKLVADHYYYIATIIPGGMYKGTPNDTKTFGAVAMVTAGQMIEHDVVYTAVRAVFENFEDFKALHPAFEKLTKKGMITQGIQVPMHGGTDKYLQKIGMR